MRKVSTVCAYLSRILETVILSMCNNFLKWEATDAISWKSCYVYVCSFALTMFKTTEGAAGCEIGL
jgi:hypothetical protein